MNVIFGRFKLQRVGIMVAVLLLFTASAAGCGKIAIQTTTGTTSTIHPQLLLFLPHYQLHHKLLHWEGRLVTTHTR